MNFLRIVVLLSIVALFGCQSESVSVEQPEALPAAENAKVLLEGVAETGQLGSGAMSLRESLEELKQADAAKADPLLADLDELESLTDPAAIKAKAREMADKLGGQPESAEQE